MSRSPKTKQKACSSSHAAILDAIDQVSGGDGVWVDGAQMPVLDALMNSAREAVINALPKHFTHLGRRYFLQVDHIACVMAVHCSSPKPAAKSLIRILMERRLSDPQQAPSASSLH